MKKKKINNKFITNHNLGQIYGKELCSNKNKVYT